MLEGRGEIERVSLCTSQGFGKPEEFISKLEVISNIQTRGSIQNKIVDIDQENEFDSEIGFAASGILEPLSAENNAIHCDKFEKSEEDSLHIHLNSDNDHLEEFDGLFSDIVSEVGEVEANTLILYLILDDEFESYEAEFGSQINGSGRIQGVSGVRVVTDNDEDVLIQEASEGNTHVRYGVRIDRKIDGPPVESVLNNSIEDCIDVVEDIKT